MNLPVLGEYTKIVTDKEFWNCWPKNNRAVGKTRIQAQKLKVMALEAGFRDNNTLQKVVTDLTEGARIGCTGKFRNPSVSYNSSMAYENGERVSDAIAEWVREGYARGPVNRGEVPK